MYPEFVNVILHFKEPNKIEIEYFSLNNIYINLIIFLVIQIKTSKES